MPSFRPASFGIPTTGPYENVFDAGSAESQFMVRGNHTEPKVWVDTCSSHPLLRASLLPRQPLTPRPLLMPRRLPGDEPPRFSRLVCETFATPSRISDTDPRASTSAELSILLPDEQTVQFSAKLREDIVEEDPFSVYRDDVPRESRLRACSPGPS